MEENKLIQAVKISDEINKWLEAASKNLPYNINVIDELHANENAHSRILCKLLQYRDQDDRYRILESLISYIATSFPETDFGNIKICNPQITQEIERIDLWVQDKDGKYAIIFENKVNGAMDQNSQLYRYIAKTTEHGFKLEQIFIVYLPGDDHEPSKQTWGPGDNKEKFKSRYAKLSFGSDIITWLKNDVLPYCVIKEDILISAIKQYVDHLEGLYKMRASQQKTFIMTPNMLQTIGISSTQDIEQFKEIDSVLDRLRQAKDTLINHRAEYIQRIMKPFVKEIKNTLGEKWEYVDNISTGQGWLYMYNNDWLSKNYIHLEWSDMFIDKLFNSTEYKVVLHAEGPYIQHNITKEICAQLNLSRHDKTLWTKTFKSTKSLGDMTEKELCAFFKSIYQSEEIQKIIKTIDAIEFKK